MSSYEALIRCAALGCEAPVAVLALTQQNGTAFKAGVGVQFAPDELISVENLAAVVETQILYAADGTQAGVLAVGRHDGTPFTQAHRKRLQDFAEIASSLVHSGREHALRRLMSRAVEEAFDFVLLTDASTPSQGGPFIEYVNSSLLYALGYTSDELLGRPYNAIFATTNDPATLQSIAANLESARDNEKEVQLRRKDGTTFWAEFTGRPLFDAAGAPTHWFAVGRDITSNRDTLTQMAALVNALDTVADHVEIYTYEAPGYALGFQNRAAQPAVSDIVERLLCDPSVQRRLKNGETLRTNGVMLRPVAHGETVICVRRQPGRFAKVS
ncbi:MAG TPA: PAS domain-containing protein [Candidatus Baltobacteraceae bacterium]|nr:PAS domain-containing protein [Candidatus Baltobacteraceae bacterium]